MYFARKFPHWAGTGTAMTRRDLEAAGTQVVPIPPTSPAPALPPGAGGPQPASNTQHGDRGGGFWPGMALQA